MKTVDQILLRDPNIIKNGNWTLRGCRALTAIPSAHPCFGNTSRSKCLLSHNREAMSAWLFSSEPTSNDNLIWGLIRVVFIFLIVNIGGLAQNQVMSYNVSEAWKCPTIEMWELNSFLNLLIAPASITTVGNKLQGFTTCHSYNGFKLLQFTWVSPRSGAVGFGEHQFSTWLMHSFIISYISISQLRKTAAFLRASEVCRFLYSKPFKLWDQSSNTEW